MIFCIFSKIFLIFGKIEVTFSHFFSTGIASQQKALVPTQNSSFKMPKKDVKSWQNYIQFTWFSIVL